MGVLGSYLLGVVYHVLSISWNLGTEELLSVLALALAFGFGFDCAGRQAGKEAGRHANMQTSGIRDGGIGTGDSSAWGNI